MNSLTLEIVRDLESNIRENPDVPKQTIGDLLANSSSSILPVRVQVAKQGYQVTAGIINYDGNFFCLYDLSIKDPMFKPGKREEWLEYVVTSFRDMLTNCNEYVEEKDDMKRHFFMEQLPDEKDGKFRYRVIEVDSNGEIKIYMQECSPQANNASEDISMLNSVYKRRALGEVVDFALSALGYSEADSVSKPSFRDQRFTTCKDLEALLDPFENDPDKAYTEIATDVLGSYNLMIKLRQVAVEPITNEPVYEVVKIEVEDPEDGIYGDETNEAYDEQQKQEIYSVLKRLKEKFTAENNEANFIFTDQADETFSSMPFNEDASVFEQPTSANIFDGPMPGIESTQARNDAKYANRVEVSFVNCNTYAIRFYREDTQGAEQDTPLLLTKSQILVLAGALMHHNNKSRLAYEISK